MTVVAYWLHALDSVVCTGTLVCLTDKHKQLQQFGKPTWHPYNFGKTRKIGLQQFGKPTWQK
jgi:hypothetical protein